MQPQRPQNEKKSKLSRLTYLKEETLSFDLDCLTMHQRDNAFHLVRACEVPIPLQVRQARSGDVFLREFLRDLSVRVYADDHLRGERTYALVFLESKHMFVPHAAARLVLLILGFDVDNSVLLTNFPCGRTMSPTTPTTIVLTMTNLCATSSWPSCFSGHTSAPASWPTARASEVGDTRGVLWSQDIYPQGRIQT